MQKQKFKSPLAWATIVIILAAYGLWQLVGAMFSLNNLDNNLPFNLTDKADSLYVSYTPVPVVKVERKPQFAPQRVRIIELNSADTTALKRIYGIGSVLSRRIIEYRERLGGYASAEQLLEVKGIRKELFSSIQAVFSVDSSCLNKIFINFAPQSLITHPYGGRSVHKRITNYLNSKGGIFKLKDLSEKNILLPSEAKSLAPYLCFSTNEDDYKHSNSKQK